MNNKELTGELSRRLGYTNKDAAQLIASMVDIMGEQLQEGKRLDFDGFGTFSVKKELERIVYNPASKQRFLVPPKLVLIFEPASFELEKHKNSSFANG